MIDKVYELMIKQLKIVSILDLKIKWLLCQSWLACFSWVSKSQAPAIEYLKKRGFPEYVGCDE